MTGDVTGEKGHQRNGQLAGKLVQAHRKPALSFTNEVYLHDYDGGLCESLVQAQQDIRDHDPVPLVGRHQDERDRNCRGPSGDQQLPPTEAVGQVPGELVGHGFDDAEHNHERQHRTGCRHVEFLCRNEWQDRSFHPDHATHERVDDHQQDELAKVLSQPECGGEHGGNK
jgi:hypothetical protein